MDLDPAETGHQEVSIATSNTKRVGRYALVATGVVLLGFCAGAAPFVMPAFRKNCLPYVSATNKQIGMCLALKNPKHKTLVDLGSGDGRVVIAAAKKGLQAHGIEMNRWLVWYSRWRAYREGVWQKTSFSCGDLWKADITKYDTLVVFGVQEMMPLLEEKLSRDMRPTAEIIACRFPLATWTPRTEIEDPLRSMGLNSVYVYDKQ
eukprot:CFRG2604T1